MATPETMLPCSGLLNRPLWTGEGSSGIRRVLAPGKHGSALVGHVSDVFPAMRSVLFFCDAGAVWFSFWLCARVLYM